MTTASSLRIIPTQEQGSEKTINDLPNEILYQIFESVLHTKDFLALASTCKRFYKISKERDIFRCQDLVPRFISEATDPTIRALSTLKKAQLTFQIKSKLVSKEPLQTVFSKQFPDRRTGAIPKALLGDYIALCPDDSGYVHFGRLGENQLKIFAAHLERIFNFTVIQKPTPLLVTSTESEWKIWDLKKIADGQEGLVKQQTNLELQLINNKPVIATYRHFLGVGHKDKIEIFNCRQLSEPPLTLQLNPEQIRQISFSESYFMLVLNTRVVIWEMTAIEEKHTLEQETAYRVINIPLISFAKILEGNKVAIIYANPDNGSIGEVRCIKTGDLLKVIHKPTDAILSIDSQADPLATGFTNFAYQGSMYTDSYRLDNIGKDHRIKAFMLGQAILFAGGRGIRIYNASNFSLQASRDYQMNEGEGKHDDFGIISFDLDGTRLLMERWDGNTNLRELFARRVTVYDLAAPPAGLLSRISYRFNMLLFKGVV